MSGTDEADQIKGGTTLSGDSVPRPLGFIALVLIPVNEIASAPAARSVSVTAVLCNILTKKELDYRSAIRHVA